MKLSGHLYEVFAEDFRKELAEIQNPTVRHLFILAKINHLIHLRIAEYKALIAAADLSGHYGVGVLLESCLADKLALAERTRRVRIKSTGSYGPANAVTNEEVGRHLPTSPEWIVEI